MKIDLFSYTDKGSRSRNEDFSEVYQDEKVFAAVLCDGLGGHNRGDVASKTAVGDVIEGIKFLPEITDEGINSVLSVVNDHLIKCQEENPGYNGMRTTVVGCAMEGGGNLLHYFNAGDSRFYFFKNHTLNCMSKDHSVSRLSVEMGQISFNDIRFDADRSKLLKVLGESGTGNVCAVYPPVTVESGDAFLLCSDGFWEYVLEEEMEADLEKSRTAEEWIQLMLARLRLKCGEENDNYTAVGGIFKGDAGENVAGRHSEPQFSYRRNRQKSEKKKVSFKTILLICAAAAAIIAASVFLGVKFVGLMR